MVIRDDEPDISRRPDVSRRYVRILKRRPDGFVEFVFSIDDPDLGVELILPRAGFERFCADNRVQFVSPDQAIAIDTHNARWRYGAPGLTE